MLMRGKRIHASRRSFIYGMVFLAVAFAVYAPVGLALKPGEVSLTEERLAGLRAIAAMDPDKKVRNPDYLAEKFLSPEFWFFGLLTKDYVRTKQFIEAYGINAYYMANAMTWHIDGILQSMAANAVKQVVHIGAGFDSRPYRFGETMHDVQFFEVDQPATLNQKTRMVKAIFGELPDNVTYIPFDYRSKPVFDVLTRAGYDQRLKSLFVWEATTVLTDRTIVDNTLQSIARRSAFGSEVVFDYVPDAVVNGDFSKYPGARYEVVQCRVKGEPWKFGIAEGQTVDFMARRGLRVISDLGTKDLAGRYLVKSDGSLDGTPTPYRRIVHAVVSE